MSGRDPDGRVINAARAHSIGQGSVFAGIAIEFACLPIEIALSSRQVETVVDASVTHSSGAERLFVDSHLTHSCG